MAIINRFRQFRSLPFPVRGRVGREADTQEYLQPQPRLDGPAAPYLTYWSGNQMPGSFIHTANPIQLWNSVKTHEVLWQNSPYAAQRTGGQFNRVAGVGSSAQIVATWRLAWQTAKARYSPS